MKLFIPSLLICCSLTGHSQGSETDRFTGIYRTKEDFILNNIEFKKETDSLNSMTIEYDGTLVLKRAGIVSRMPKAMVFGFYRHGSKYRSFTNSKKFFAVNGYFRLEDQDVICIYSQEGYLKTADTEFYFFSRTIDSPIYRLHIRQLEQEFPNNKPLHEALKSNRLRFTEKQDKHFVLNNLILQFYPDLK